MEIIWSTVLTVWGWLLELSVAISTWHFLLSYHIFQRRAPKKCMGLGFWPLYFILVFESPFTCSFWPGYEKEQDVPSGRGRPKDRLNSHKSQEDHHPPDDMEEMMDPMSRILRA